MQAKDSIVARLMRAIRLGGKFEIYGDGRQVRDYVHVSDVIAAMRLGLTNEQWSGPVVIGAGRSLSVLEVVDAVRDVTGADIDVGHGPAKAGEMPAVIVDNSKRTRGRAGRRNSLSRRDSWAYGRSGRRSTTKRCWRAPGPSACPGAGAHEMSLARQQREEHVAAPAKPFAVDAEIAALEPGERDAARDVPGDAMRPAPARRWRS